MLYREGSVEDHGDVGEAGRRPSSLGDARKGVEGKESHADHSDLSKQNRAAGGRPDERREPDREEAPTSRGGHRSRSRDRSERGPSGYNHDRERERERDRRPDDRSGRERDRAEARYAYFMNFSNIPLFSCVCTRSNRKIAFLNAGQGIMNATATLNGATCHRLHQGVRGAVGMMNEGEGRTRDGNGRETSVRETGRGTWVNEGRTGTGITATVAETMDASVAPALDAVLTAQGNTQGTMTRAGGKIGMNRLRWVT